MPKYKECVHRMIELHSELFEKFGRIHNKYLQDPPAYQDEFNKVGYDVMQVVREYEDKLCSRTEGNGYASFSPALAEKFENEVRKLFPKIDCVGIIPQSSEEEFVLNRINL